MPAVRHLPLSTAAATLRRGRGLEQFLGLEMRDEQLVLRWLTLTPTRDDRRRLVLTEALDDSDVMGWDIGEFRAVDEDADEKPWQGEFETSEEAFAAAATLGAREDRWVNEGLAGDEFGEAYAAFAQASSE